MQRNERLRKHVEAFNYPNHLLLFPLLLRKIARTKKPKPSWDTRSFLDVFCGWCFMLVNPRIWFQNPLNRDVSGILLHITECVIRDCCVRATWAAKGNILFGNTVQISIKLVLLRQYFVRRGNSSSSIAYVPVWCWQSALDHVLRLVFVL